MVIKPHNSKHPSSPRGLYVSCCGVFFSGRGIQHCMYYKGREEYIRWVQEAPYGIEIATAWEHIDRQTRERGSVKAS